MVPRTLVRVTTAILALGLLADASASAQNAPPDAGFGFFPRDPVSGQMVRFVSYACDPDGSLVEQAWDLDNDGSFDDGRNAQVVTSFTAGLHTVRLRATDNDGAAVVRARTVGVVPGSPEYVAPAPFSPPLLSPFPVVRLAGRLTETGARIRLLTVRAPICSRVTTRCRGRSCPFRRRTKLAGRKVTRIRAIQGKNLSAGVRLEVLISKRDRIGKYTRFRIRRDRPPLRLDRCLRFGDTRGTPCPNEF
jgi:PKD domain